ncbi:hypothetical protein B0T18DRAFT_448813 [Schizothecium vesticola]|uniref:Uncharacterized protein n=1 Tax=Schizothecium vesticola TaxID=314040 RepID=A0AA40BTJ1_9PEZI|nr:hypothetical protein B0T18DRAFT_448813 [Schizothecium vesticola]
MSASRILVRQMGKNAATKIPVRDVDKFTAFTPGLKLQKVKNLTSSSGTIYDHLFTEHMSLVPTNFSVAKDSTYRNCFVSVTTTTSPNEGTPRAGYIERDDNLELVPTMVAGEQAVNWADSEHKWIMAKLNHEPRALSDVVVVKLPVVTGRAVWAFALDCKSSSHLDHVCFYSGKPVFEGVDVCKRLADNVGLVTIFSHRDPLGALHFVSTKDATLMAVELDNYGKKDGVLVYEQGAWDRNQQAYQAGKIAVFPR